MHIVLNIYIYSKSILFRVTTEKLQQSQNLFEKKMCQILRDSSVTALQQQRAASVVHQAFPPPRPHRGAPLQLRSATVESWRLGLTAHAVGQVFWSPGPPPYKSKSYIYPTTLDGKKFRMDRIAVCTTWR